MYNIIEGKKEETTMEVLESLFEKALRLELPWKITRIEFTEKQGTIKVFIDFQRRKRL